MTTLALDGPVTEAAAKTRKFPRVIIAIGIALLLAAAGILWIETPKSSESTDNAYLKADSSVIAPKVGGLIAEIFVKENQSVNPGDPLVRIDAQEFDARLASADAAVADAEARVSVALAALSALGSEQSLAAARTRTTQGAIVAADAEAERPRIDRARFEQLAALGFATRRDTERVRAGAIAATANAEQRRSDRQVAAQAAGVTAAQRPVLLAELSRARAAVGAAIAARNLALQDQASTIIRAPSAGIVGNREVQIGDFVRPGTQLMRLVPTQGLYVVANFKETQTQRMLVGQHVEISVDALGGGTLTGQIESFAPASSSEFSLLPFEPGSGNFTKIVQRIAVRIKLDPNQKPATRLRPGLSVTTKVTLTQ
jgi:membrane fusion protein, multidrug efflux system